MKEISHKKFDPGLRSGRLWKALLILRVIFIHYLGLSMLSGEKIPWMGDYPEILSSEREISYFPITTSILISIIDPAVHCSGNNGF